MWGIFFEIKAPFGHFRNPYTTTFKQSYPFPPKPTVIGMIGAILGWREQKVIEVMDEFKVAIPLFEHSGKIIEFTFILSAGKVIRNHRQREEYRPERFEILVRPKFHIIVLHEDEKIIKGLEEKIGTKDYEFPLYMGKNEFLITDIKILRSSFQANVCKVINPSGVVFKEGNLIPEFTVNTSKIRPAEVFIGVPKSLELFKGRRIQKDVCVALVTNFPIKLKEPLDGIILNGNEYSII